MTPVLAHLGHWYFYPLYAIPVVIVLFSAITTTIRERRAEREEQARPAPGGREDE